MFSLSEKKTLKNFLLAKKCMTSVCELFSIAHLCALIENKHVIVVEKTELGFETTQCIAKVHFFWSIRPLGMLQPAKTKKEPNCHAGTQSTFCLICTKNKLKQEIDFIKKILLDNGYPEDIGLRTYSRKLRNFLQPSPLDQKSVQC